MTVKNLFLKYVVNRLYEEGGFLFYFVSEVRNGLRTGRRRVCSQLAVKLKISLKSWVVP